MPNKEPNQIKIFQVEAILEGVNPLKDGGMSLRFHTNEVAKDRKAALMDFYQSFGWLQFSDSEIHTVPKEAPVRELGQKTPGQRLRAVIFLLWQDRHTDQTFEEFYAQQMEKFIDRIKQELPPQ